MPNRAANAPPRSISATTITGSPVARARPILAMSLSRRLISAGLPAPSQTTTSNLSRRSARQPRTVSCSAGLRSRYESASASATGAPSTMTWLRPLPPGLSSTGFMAASGSTPAAAACIAWARPISPPSWVTAEFSDMFCALKGATLRPWRASQRQIPATITLLPASDVVPATSRPVTVASARPATASRCLAALGRREAAKPRPQSRRRPRP